MKLTEEQIDSLWRFGEPKLGLQVISARAGTGKTTITAEYFKDLVSKWSGMFSPWQGIAMLSYTNVAKDEMKRKIQGDVATLDHPHSIETIDAFFNSRVFLPHGSAVMGAESRPRLVGEPYSIFKLSNDTILNKYGAIARLDNAYLFDKTYYGVDGRIYPKLGKLNNKHNGKLTVSIPIGDNHTTINWFNINGVESKCIKELKKYKSMKHSQGLASQADANYFALKTLLESEYITKGLIKRYPVFIIDEAQDMTEIQHAIIDHLIDSGLKNVILIGDEQQAIYEWNTARPELLTEKSLDTRWSNSVVSETFRNSQNICDTLNNHTKTGDIKPHRASKNAKYRDSVKIVDWNIEGKSRSTILKSTVDELARHISNKKPHDNNELCLAVLTRSKYDAMQSRALYLDSQPQNITFPNFKHPHSEDILKIVHHLAQGDTYNAFKGYEKMLRHIGGHLNVEEMKTSILSRIGIADINIYNYRKTLYSDLLKIKSTLTNSTPMSSSLSSISDWRLSSIPESAVNQIESDYSIYKEEDQPIADIMVPENNILR